MTFISSLLTYQDGNWFIENLNANYGTYVNYESIQSKKVYHGDIIFIMGLKIIPLGNKLIVNKVDNLVRIDDRIFKEGHFEVQSVIDEGDLKEEDIDFYKEEDYFFRSPRFKAGIEKVLIEIDAPPAKEKMDDTPLLYVIGPMISMGMVSLMMGYSSVQGVVEGNQTLASAIPTIIMCVAMLLTMILWPLLNRKFQRKKSAEREVLRQTKYKEYIENKKYEIKKEMENEKKVLEENYISLNETEKIVLERKRNLWEREIDQKDFLDLRLGIGNRSFAGEVRYPEDRFSLEDDNLKELVQDLGKESKELENVPINLSFCKNNISAIIGEGKQKNSFIDGLMLQLVAFHSYTDLKVVLFTNEKNASRWEYLKSMPHNWNNTRTLRYFSSNYDEAKALSLELEQVLKERTEQNTNNDLIINTDKKDYTSFAPYFFIIIDDFKSVRELEIIKDICNSKINVGFSIVIVNNRLTNLPNECHTFVSINDAKSGIFENELVSEKQKEFISDYNPNIDMYSIAKVISNIPIETEKESSSLPNMISFLEMYDCGRVEQLDILNRWKNSNPTKTLQAPIGVDKNHELFKLDIHEKAHGPHGLIAGMTGSGKSELIITYILSMALNYSPDEVSFILIDYKGGGLAGAFENKETGVRLPHIAGTITNLDTSEIYRALASVQSELRRRQKKFNEVRDNLNESTIDIYKYQTLYKEGLVKEPIPHLIIISDEFAELKDQKPEFMDELISTARIGRSLGVHLILATQKPAGVVNDQIWSNSKFRICLKVQDRSDSMDMIKSPVAAAIKETGRFYLQVGYNELFALGQSAWTGAKYYPQDKKQKKIDERIDFVDNIGNVIKSFDSTNRQVKLVAEGEEITSLIKYINEEARKENKYAKQLWLEKIPDFIYTEELKNKYNYNIELNNINPIIGELDDPNNQRQALLTLPLSEKGNAAIFGRSGSGKDLFLQSLIYSTITDHTPKEVNFYLMDFGSETLRSFKDAPQVGDIIFQNEEEKVNNLFKLLDKELETRKKLFIDYNGDYNFYLKHSGKQLPLIVTVINNYDAFSETFDSLSDDFAQLTREGIKYGIIFIVTCNSVNSLRYRIKQNFGQNITTQFNDENDYQTILGNTHKKYPSNAYGRGLIGLDSVYEFQTAYPYNENKLSEYIKVVSTKLSKIFNERAKKVPTLPVNITQETVSNALNRIDTIPLGIEKESLKIATYNASKEKFYIITGNNIEDYPYFINNLVKTYNYIDNHKTIVIDTMELIKENSSLIVNTNFNETIKTISREIINEINNFRETGVQNLDSTTIILVGLSNLLPKLDIETKQSFQDMLKNITALKDINVVIIDNIDRIKNLSFEMWLKDNLNLGEGLWLGNGVLDQFTLKLTNSPRELREEIQEQYAIQVVKGKPVIIKLLEGDIYNG